jgi:hypothetical protein
MKQTEGVIMNINIVQKSKYSWEIRIGKIIISNITHFHRCEVQDPDEPEFVPFYNVSFNINGHVDHSVGSAVETFDDAVKEILRNLCIPDDYKNITFSKI